KYINIYLLLSKIPPRCGLLRLGRRADSDREPDVPDVQNVPDIESVREQAGDNSPPRARRRVEVEEEEMDALRDLRQEILELGAENRALREETVMLRGRPPIPDPVPPAPVPQPPPVQEPPPAQIPPPAQVPPDAYVPPPVQVPGAYVPLPAHVPPPVYAPPVYAPPAYVPPVYAPPAYAPPSAYVPRRMDRRVLDDEGVSVSEFLKLQTPEFMGEQDEDPQEFLNETEKMIRPLRCSDARLIELVGIKLKRNAWDWFQRNIEEQLYGDNPPTWEAFKQAILDEFISPAERQNRALQFERLRQSFGMSVADYAKEFIRLSKYAPWIVPTEAARVERFRTGLKAPLYNALLAAEYPTLSKIIDKAKLWEIRNKEERVRKEQRGKFKKGGQGSRNKSEGVSAQIHNTEAQSQFTSQSQIRRGQKRGQSQGSSVQSAPGGVQTYTYPTCTTCGKRHFGQCKIGSRACYQCGQSGHYAYACPQRCTQQFAAPASQTTVQADRPAGRGAAGRGRPQPQALAQAPAPAGRGQGRVYAVNHGEAQASNAAVTGIPLKF